MADGSLFLDFGQELVVDLFAGGGGASMGIARAYREPDVAVNHNEIAVAVHRANHPATKHFQCDVFEVDPLMATGGRPVGVLWASPDCRHHSKAAGGKPRSKRVRGLAWVIIKWAEICKPRIIHLENVEEFADWGPLDDEGKPDQARKGITFRRWVRELERRGYKVESRVRIAANAGAPTIRKRLYVIARRDGRPIVWPASTHAKVPTGTLKPWRTAGECIDFSLPAKSIFDRKKPLARNTCKRIAKGAWRYVLNCTDPYIVGNVAPYLTEHANAGNQRTFAANEPLRTQCANVKGGHFALVSAYLVPRYGERAGQEPRSRAVSEPMPTIVPTGNGGNLVQAGFMEQANGGFYDGDGRSLLQPCSTVMTSGANQRLVTAYLVKYYGNERDGVPLTDPMHTIPTKDRMGLVQTVQVSADILSPELQARAKQCADFLREYLPENFPEPAEMVLVGGYVLVDFTLRMLVPMELAKAQGFNGDYIIDRGLFETYPGSDTFEWRPITKTDQVRLIGNSVCPDEAEALVRANASDLIELYQREAA